MQEVSSSFETRLHSKYSHKIILNLVTIHRGHTDIITCLPFRYLESRRHTQVQFTALVVPCCCFSMANFISKASTLKHKTLPVMIFTMQCGQVKTIQTNMFASLGIIPCIMYIVVLCFNVEVNQKLPSCKTDHKLCWW